MTSKRDKNLYLYLALVCFVGILAIFVIDGYLGIYDTLYITVQEREERIEPDYWQQNRITNYGYSMGASWGEPVYFKYEIDNNRFSSYPTTVDVSVWKGGEKILDLLNEEVSLLPFDEVTLDWTLRTEELRESGFEVGEYTIRIGREAAERKIILGFHDPAGLQYPKAPVPLYR